MRVATAISAPSPRTFIIKSFVRIPVFGSLGFSCKSRLSAGSMPMASAGRESVRRLMNNRCTGAKGRGFPASEVISTVMMAAILPERRNRIAFRIFRYTFLPLATALMIVAKLSSDKIISAASLDTSVPVIPRATPISAFFNAGASLTPSPVMDTMQPFRCHASTIRILFSGDTLAYTDIREIISSNSSSVIASSSVPVKARSPSV